MQRTDVRAALRQRKLSAELLAAILYHRAQARIAAGKESLAKKDLEEVRKLGFEPGPKLD